MLAGSTIQISLELSPRFYRYGYGLPLYHIVNGGRHLLFNSHSRFALDVGVLLIYFGVFWIVAALTSAYWIKKQERKILEKKQQTKTNTNRPLVSSIQRYRIYPQVQPTDRRNFLF